MAQLLSTLRRGRKRRLAAAAALLLDLESLRSRKKRKAGNKHRTRLDWFKHCESIDSRLFKRAYRVTPESFDVLLEKIRHLLEKNVAQARRSSGSRVEPETRLAIALRYLAGGSYIDICFTHGVNHATFYKIVWEVLEAINDAESITFPTTDVAQLEAMAAKFGLRSDGVFDGCVGALDGLCIRIRRPHEHECGGNPMDYHNRKGFFSLNLATGKTHDSKAWALSNLAKEVEEEKLPSPFWIAGDDAYAVSNSLLAPYPGKNLGKEKDTFNYFQSNCRIHIEQAFGILVARWGILWRPLTCALDRVPLVVSCCMKLHNICRRASISMGAPLNKRSFGAGKTQGDARPNDHNPMSSRRQLRQASDYIDAGEVCDAIKRHRERERSARRDELAKKLQDHGYSRPRYSNYSVE